MKELEYPKFAVVGHPNKGKSTIVSALSSDENVLIGNRPGLTKTARSFPLKKDNEIIYEIIDTPGFQRPRRVLEWLESQPHVSIDRQKNVVKEFVEKHKNIDNFRDEIELLQVILDGALIIYVVDASKPYSSEYETEMKILKWTGQPSMAILNFIGESDYSEDWKNVLDYFFQMSRRFNPMEMNFNSYLSIFESIAQLKEEWIKPIKYAISILTKDYDNSINKTVEVIFEYIIEITSYLYYKEISIDIEYKEENIFIEYKNHINDIEKSFEERIESIWNHNNIFKEVDILDLNRNQVSFKRCKNILGIELQENFLIKNIIIPYLPEISKKFKYFKKYNLIYGPIVSEEIYSFIVFKAIKYSSLIIKHSHASREKIIFYKKEDIELMLNKNKVNLKYILKLFKLINKSYNINFKNKILKNIKDLLINNI